MNRDSAVLVLGSEVARVFALADFSIAAEGGALRLPVAVTGQWTKQTQAGEQHISLTLDDLRTMARNFAKKENGEVNVDYDHKSEQGAEIADPIPSAGRVTELLGPEQFTDAQGVQRYILWGRYEPTARARQLIAAKEYRFTSPAFGQGIDRATGKPQGVTLSTVALTNRPVILSMPRICMSRDGHSAKSSISKSGGIMEGNRIAFCSEESYADTRLSELVKTCMAETGKTQCEAEIAVVQTAEGQAAWEEARKASLKRG